MNTLIIEPQNKVDYQLFIDLAKRLNVKYREEVDAEEAKKEADFFALAGSFDLPETSEELAQCIEKARISKNIDVKWAD